MADLMFLYDLGVIFAIISGILTSIGYLMQKKVVNGVPSDNQFFKTLIKNKLWLWGLIFNLGFSSIFFMIAQLWVGPALIPGLMASGLIVLAMGSVRLLGEKLKPDEIFGIILMITATALLGFSNLSINININMFDSGFITRTTLFTVVSFIFIIICHIFQSRKANWRAVLLSVESGAMLGISYFWIGPMMDILTNIFGSNYQLGFLIYLIIASVILVVTKRIVHLVFAISISEWASKQYGPYSTNSNSIDADCILFLYLCINSKYYVIYLRGVWNCTDDI